VIHDHDEHFVFRGATARYHFVVGAVFGIAHVVGVGRQRTGDEFRAQTAKTARRLGYFAVEADEGSDSKIAVAVRARCNMKTVAGCENAVVLRRFKRTAVHFAIDIENFAFARKERGGIVNLSVLGLFHKADDDIEI
jgi:hypothetical protein